MRPRVFSLALPWLTLACSDGSGTVLSTKPDPDPGLVLGECAGERTDCTSVVEVRAYEPGPTVECTMLDRGEGSIIWALTQEGIECPAPPCSLGRAFVEAMPNGRLEAMAEISGVNGPGAGWWFATFGADGTPMGSVVRDFTTETRLSEPKFLLPFGFDAAGNAFVVERSGDINISADFTTQILRFDAARRDSELVVSLEHVMGVAAAIANDGSLAASITWSRDAYSPDNSWTPEASSVLLDVARFDPAGRLIWNQPKLGRDMALTHFGIAGFDAAGNLTVLLTREDHDRYFPPPQLRDGSLLTFNWYRVVRFDGDGNVVGVYDLPQSFGAEAIAAPNGSVYVVRRPLSVDADAYYVIEAPVVEKLNGDGRSAWILRVPDVAFDGSQALDVDDEGNLVVASRREVDALAEFHVISADGQRCQTFRVPCLVGSEGMLDCASDAPDVAHDGSIYFDVGRAVSPP